MSDALSTVLAIEGLWVVMLGAGMAGIVRGFTGFGTAMVYLPIASTVVSPVFALVSMMVMDAIGPLPLVPRALREGNKRDMLLLLAGLVVFLPVGLMLLTRMDPEVYRVIVAIATLAALALMISGVRFRGRLTRPMIVGTGGVGGFLGGVAGLPGPPVIVLYMASSLPAQAIRANLILYLLLADVLTIGLLTMGGHMSWVPMLLGVVVLVPYMACAGIGAALFRPGMETSYRVTAYVIIFGSAISALPIWGFAH